MISYEVVFALALVSILVIYGTADLREIVKMQIGSFGGVFPKWGIFLQPATAFLFIVTAFAETNRLPFDLPEGEAELVAGYHTEYGGLKFACFMLAEYLHMIMASSIFVLLFLGGWNLPGLVLDGQLVLSLLGVGVFWVKVFLVIWFFIWVRFTLPRFRYDQLMGLGWKVLLPLGLVNVMVTAVVVYWKG